MRLSTEEGRGVHLHALNHMNPIETLLAYMALTVAAQVGASGLPSNLPEVTAAPQAIVETTDMPEPTSDGVMIIGSVTVTAPPATPVPAPTITPNPAYRNLGMKDRGDQVRRLQERLKELGYLSGNIDGVFGYQTRNAVLLFQRYNGLSPDGVAGRATQTRLFEDEQVVPNPETVTPSPVPTATPDPDGLIPVSADERASWDPLRKAGLLYNGAMLPVEESFVWLRDGEAVLDMTVLTPVCGWQMSENDRTHVTFELMGFVMSVDMPERLRGEYGEGTSYFQTYDVRVGDSEVETAQGQVMFDEGHWYMSSSFLASAIGAECVWEEDEQVLILRVTDAQLAGSVD